MRMLIYWIIAIMGVTLAVFLMGPKAIIKHPPTKVPTVPGDSEGLEKWLAKREAETLEPLKQGVEATLRWRYEDKRKTPYSIVYLHGFSSSRHELSPVPEQLAEALGANLFLSRFKGHGSESGELMKQAQLTDWMTDSLGARAIGEQIGEKVIIIGTSQGGLLATWVSTINEGFQNPPAAVLLVSPNFGPYDKRTQLLSLPWAKQILPLFFGKHQHWEPQNSGHEHYWNTKYPSEALFPMMAQVNYIEKHTPEKLNVPCIVLYSSGDLTVDSGTILSAYDRFASQHKKLVEIENVKDRKNHILAGEILSPNSTDRVLDEMASFIEGLNR